MVEKKHVEIQRHGHLRKKRTFICVLYVWMDVWMDGWMDVCIHKYKYKYVYIYILISVIMCIYIYIHIYIHIYVYIDIYTHVTHWLFDCRMQTFQLVLARLAQVGNKSEISDSEILAAQCQSAN